MLWSCSHGPYISQKQWQSRARASRGAERTPRAGALQPDCIYFYLTDSGIFKALLHAKHYYKRSSNINSFMSHNSLQMQVLPAWPSLYKALERFSNLFKIPQFIYCSTLPLTDPSSLLPPLTSGLTLGHTYPPMPQFLLRHNEYVINSSHLKKC